MSERMMRRAIRLARKGTGFNSPNPLVGAVLVKHNTIIGEGYHKIAGTPHAEVNAIAAALRRGHDPKGATLYVTLEPCSHVGKTPPCAAAIIDHKIQHVVIGSIDPDPRNRGKGLAELKQHGIKVTAGNLTRECVELNLPFFMAKQRNRPLVIAKYAMTIDGKIATETGESKWISGPASRSLVQDLRQQVDAVVVGVGTVLSDNPRLSYRTEKRLAHSDRELLQPLRVVIDPVMQIPETCQVIEQRPELTVIFCASGRRVAKIKRLRDRGVTVIETDEYPLPADRLLAHLFERDVQSVLVEGGGKTLGRFFFDRCLDRVFMFVGPMVFGGDTAPTPAGGEGILSIKDHRRFSLEQFRRLGDDVLLNYHSIEFGKCLQDWLNEQESYWRSI